MSSKSKRIEVDPASVLFQVQKTRSLKEVLAERQRLAEMEGVKLSSRHVKAVSLF